MDNIEVYTPVNQTEKDEIYPKEFVEYCESIGIHPDDFRNLDNNIHKIVYGAQKAVSLLFFKNCAIVNKRMNQHLEDEITYPQKQISGMKLMFEMFVSITGTDKFIDENTAIKSLESRGYKIDRNSD